MKRKAGKSNCAINYSLETFGDMWSLLIIRDIILFGKHTYGEFLDSDERIATNILASKLSCLVSAEILHKSSNPADKRKDIYTITEKGLALIPMFFEMMEWGVKYNDLKTPKEAVDFIKKFKKNKIKVAQEVMEKVRAGGSVFS
ncbi:MAG TPA: helix-turn-helix domain-containing protein [Candidatus Udaeobacter sp.]|nr:helix-turn-helix domain-containing protein [Candidatus Udaeobacter sp.]